MRYAVHIRLPAGPRQVVYRDDLAEVGEVVELVRHVGGVAIVALRGETVPDDDARWVRAWHMEPEPEA